MRENTTTRLQHDWTADTEHRVQALESDLGRRLTIAEREVISAYPGGMTQ